MLKIAIGSEAANPRSIKHQKPNSVCCVEINPRCRERDLSGGVVQSCYSGDGDTVVAVTVEGRDGEGCVMVALFDGVVSEYGGGDR